MDQKTQQLRREFAGKGLEAEASAIDKFSFCVFFLVSFLVTSGSESGDKVIAFFVCVCFNHLLKF